MLQHYSVWAPDAERVDVHLGVDGDRVEAMTPAGEGWWSVDADPHDGRYAFALDGGDPMPDPRGRRQPGGVHAPSALVDTGAFTWTDGDWAGRELKGSVVYELHVGTFTDLRSFDGVIEHLDHLAELGVDVVELMPVASFPGRHGWGYDGVALFSVHEPYGGPDGCSASSTPPTPAAWRSGWTWSTTISARSATTSPSSARTSPTGTRPRGASR